MKKILAIASPSGGGKGILCHYILEKYQNFSFSISATTRPKREGEIDGREYYFISISEFKEKIGKNLFLEYEEVYEGKFYGTLKSEIERIISENKIPIFDLDVDGALSLKKIYGDDSLIIFLDPPSIGVLEKRLIERGQDSLEEIEKRIKKAPSEIAKKKDFDIVIFNDDLEQTKSAIDKIIVQYFINTGK